MWKLMTAALVLMLSAPLSALADYSAGPGDVLSISIIGHQGLDRQVTIDSEGRIFLPLVGEVEAAGRSLPELRDEIVARFAEVVYQVERPGGGVGVQTISPEAVVVDIFEYRPVYVLGDVARPGEVPFRPGMTAMQALAIAGDSGRMQVDEGRTVMMAIQLQSRAEMLGETIKQHRLAIARMEADLENLMADDVETAAKPEMAARLEAGGVPSWVDARQTARALREEATKATIEGLRRRLELLAKHEEGAQSSVELDAAQVARMERLAADGYVAANPLFDARRSLLLSTGRALDIAAERGRVEVELVKLTMSDDVEDHTQAAEIIERLEKVSSDLVLAQEELRGTNARLAQIGYAPTEEAPPEYAIYRDAGEGLTRIAATGGSRLEPGDVLEMRIPLSTADADALQ